MTESTVEFGLDTFGDVTHDANGQPETYAQVIRNVIKEAVVADQVGIDFFGIGEHHREDFAVSSPENARGHCKHWRRGIRKAGKCRSTHFSS